MAEPANLRDTVLFLIRDYQAFVNRPNDFAREQAVRAVQDILCRLLVAVSNDRAAPVENVNGAAAAAPREGR